MLYYVGKDKALRKKFKTATVAEADAYISGLDAFALDTETTKVKVLGADGREVHSEMYVGGLDPYLSRVIMLQLGDLGKQYVIDTRSEDITPLLKHFSDPGKLKILHNAKFDGKMIYHCYKTWLVNVWDTMITQNVRENGKRVWYSMDKCAERVLGYKSKKPINKTLFDDELTDDEEMEWYGNVELNLIDRAERKVIDKSIREAFASKGDKPFTDFEVEYGGDDVTIPFLLYRNQKEWLDGDGWAPTMAVRLQNKFTQVLARIEYEGFNIDAEKWTELYHKNKVVLAERLDKLNKYVEGNKKLKQFCQQLDLFNPEPGCSVQWTSPTQVVEVFRKMGKDFCPKERSKSTKKEEWTVSAKALYKQMTQEFRDYFDEGIDQPLDSPETFRLGYMLFKKSQLSCTTFGTDFLENIHPVTKRIHSSYRQLMNTGRMCVDVETLIVTDKGLLRIGDIIPEREGFKAVEDINTLTHTGEYHPITNAINKGVEEMYEIELENGKKITCTLNHVFMTSLGWMSLLDIMNSDSEIELICTQD